MPWAEYVRPWLDLYDFPELSRTTELQAMARYVTGGEWMDLDRDVDFQKAVQMTERECFPTMSPLLDFTQVAVSSGTAPGYPLEKLYPKVNDFFTSPLCLGLLQDYWDSFGCVQGCSEPIWRFMPKGELLEHEKAVTGETRGITYPDKRFTQCAGRMFDEQNSCLCTIAGEGFFWDPESHVANHLNRYVDFDPLTRRLESFPWILDIDWKRWDAHFRTKFQMIIRDMRKRHLPPECHEHVDWYYDTVTARCVLDSTGRFWRMCDSEGSGTFNTYADNSVGNRILIQTAMLKSCCNGDIIVGGDDCLVGLRGTEADVRRFVDALLLVGRLAGEELTADRITISADVKGMKFFSSRPVWIEGRWVPMTTKPEKFLCAVAKWDKWLPMSVALPRLQSLLNECLWSRTCREIIVRILESEGWYGGLRRALDLHGVDGRFLPLVEAVEPHPSA